MLGFDIQGPGTGYSPVVPVTLFIFLWCNDVGAYCTGCTIGKHKLFERISPKKTWEGSIGGAVLTMIAAFLLHGFLPDWYSFMPVWAWIGMALVVVVFGTWGDLIESLMKREMGIKDSGKILPGHGGMLDRFDSALLAIPATVVYLSLIGFYI
jgi:phosphatidate cytidylyltransferase